MGWEQAGAGFALANRIDQRLMSVADFMVRWTESKERDGVKPNTVQSHWDTARLYIATQLT